LNDDRSFNLNGFNELSNNEVANIDGGGWLDVVAATIAATVIAATPVGTAIAIYYGASVVGAVASACIAVGSSCVVMDKAVNNHFK
jgi:hypothetical protein